MDKKNTIKSYLISPINAQTTIETTVPLLATVLMATSMALIGIGANTGFPSTIWSWFKIYFSTKNVATLILGIDSIVFIFSTLACIHAQSYDYIGMAQEKKVYWKKKIGIIDISEESIIQEYMKKWMAWYIKAVKTFDVGLFVFLFGAGMLFLPFSRILAFFLWISAVVELIWITYIFLERP